MSSPKPKEYLSICPIDGRYYSKVSSLTSFFSEKSLVQKRLEVEIKYLIALSKDSVVRSLNNKEELLLERIYSKFRNPEFHKIKKLEESTNHDIKAIELFLKTLFSKSIISDLQEMIHFGLTSEDINNLSYRLIFKAALFKSLIPQLNLLLNKLVALSGDYKNFPMMARTHGQKAVPTTLGKEFVVFAYRLSKQIDLLQNFKFTGKLNGAVGNFNSFFATIPSFDWISFSKKFIESLNLTPNLITTQINPYEDLIEVIQILQRVNGIVLDLNQDLWRYISDGFVTLQPGSKEVGSSTMPQKINPILFENSEGNIEIANGMFDVFTRELPISRLQRDLSDSTILRNVGSAFAYCLLSYKNTLFGLEKVSVNKKLILSNLNSDWAILGEGVQQILRKDGMKNSYSFVQKFVKGQRVTKKAWRDWLTKELPADISEATRKKLLKLSPENYLGLAGKLTELAISEIHEAKY